MRHALVAAGILMAGAGSPAAAFDLRVRGFGVRALGDAFRVDASAFRRLPRLRAAGGASA